MDTMFTIFNHYIIEIIPEINKFFSILIDVSLPKEIDILLQNKNNSEYISYNYFKHNSDELIRVQPICFNVNDVMLLAKIVESQKNEIFLKDILLTKSAAR